MKRKYLVASGVLLLAAMIGVSGLWKGEGRPSSPAAGEGDPSRMSPCKVVRGPQLKNEPTRPDLSSAEAVSRLRKLLKQEPSSSHRFETVERWAGHLADADLQQLIGDLGMEEYAGLTGWVRCALYAEWARRDPKAALARAEELPDSGDHRNYAVQQVLFSVLRGWAESDPKAALAERKRLVRRLGSASSVLTNFIFQELARRDPEAEWQRYSNCSGPLKAFFMGLDGKESVTHYLDRWDRERWSSGEAQQKFADYKIQVDKAQKALLARNGGRYATFAPVQKPGDEHVAAGAALALAEHDVEGAVAWLSTHGPGDDADHRSRITTMLREWAGAHPAEALRLIEEDRLENYTGSLAHAGIRGDLTLATLFMERMDHSERASVLLSVNTELASIHELDFFPAPGLPNRLPNFQERYDCLLEAVEAGNFQIGQKQAVLRSLYQNFRHIVPEAQQAFEAISNKR